MQISKAKGGSAGGGYEVVDDASSAYVREEHIYVRARVTANPLTVSPVSCSR